MSKKNILLKNNAAKLVELFIKKDFRLATIESCTGGLLSSAITQVSGSSAVIDRGFITYSNKSKIEMVGVKPDLIKKFGAVSAEVAAAMAKGGLYSSNADITIAVTGIAGPGGGTSEKPVGLVHIATASNIIEEEIIKKSFMFSGDREEVRMQSALESFNLLRSTYC
jgi:nicotinamide-nucleotide amidase|tara:strand:- start:827 stop:1327 length:501 start_codon:yes stop_codon:yes gene_type:complete